MTPVDPLSSTILSPGCRFVSRVVAVFIRVPSHLHPVDEIVNNATKLAKDKVEGETSRLKPVLEGILASRGDALGKTYEEEFEGGEKAWIVSALTR